MRTQNLVLLASSCLFFACSASPDVVADNTGNAAQKEVWSSADNPAIFGDTLTRKLADLPSVGEAARIPWAGNYWPTYEDNINHRWAGPTTDSPAKKYEKAFGGTGVEDAVSKYHGIDSSSGKVCTQASECDSKLGETCAKRAGATSGRCIPTWWGICHAWGPASILLPEPQKEVVKNGVTFKVQDIKALASLVHNSTTSKFVSLRCNKNNGAGDITYDANGRPVDATRECRDTNPGTYHLILANYLGLKKQSFVEDRTFDSEVWNQPMRGYKITASNPVTAQKANELLGVTTGGTTSRKSGTVLKNAWTHQSAITVTPGSSYSVKMTGTGDADLYVQFGKQPTASSYTCRPYANSSTEECVGTVPAGVTQLYVSTNGYADTSNFDLSITSGGSVPSTYFFNAAAASLVQIKADVQYISESSSSTDGNLSSSINSYTRTDHYEYILELNAAGEIAGGEWLGTSKKAHPDFLWLPTGVSGASVAGGKITYAQVKDLVDLSISAGPSVPPGTEKTVTESFTVTANQFKQFGPFKAGAGAVSAVITGSGDADIYVRKGAAPTLSSYDCRPYSDGSSESCDSSGPGNVFVGVNGYAASSEVRLTVKYVAAN